MRLVFDSVPRADGARRDVQVSIRSALRLARRASAFAFAAVARVEGDDWTVWYVDDDTYRLQPGHTIPYDATFCQRMVAGLGPRVAPVVADVPAYATAPIRSSLPVGAYAGVPLRYEGELLGTLVCLDPQPRSGVPEGLAPTLEALGELLGTMLGLDRTATEVGRRAARAEVEAHVDNLTQLGNRLAWAKVLVEQEARCRRYAHPASVISVDLDGLKRANDAGGHPAGDVLLQRAAAVLRRTSRICDHVARVGGDEFAVLAVEATEAEGEVLALRLREAFAVAGVSASVGLAARDRCGSLEEAWHAADAGMYADKRRRLNERVIRALVDPDSVPVVRRLDLTAVPGDPA